MRFSASSYKEYQQCGLRFRYRKIDRIPTPEGETTHYRWTGRLFHEAAYTAIGERRDAKSYELYTGGPRLEYALRVVDAVWEGKPFDDVSRSIMEDIGEKPEIFSPGKIKALQPPNDVEQGWRTQIKKMLENTVPTLASIHSNIVELELVSEWDFLGRQFIGYLDIVANKDGKLSFYDLKTSWHKPGKKLQEDFQFFIYSHALKTTRGLDYYPDGHWIHAKDGSILPFVVTQEIIDKHTQEAEQVFSYIENGVFPSAYGSPLCAFCDYYSLCYGEETNG